MHVFFLVQGMSFARALPNGRDCKECQVESGNWNVLAAAPGPTSSPVGTRGCGRQISQPELELRTEPELEVTYLQSGLTTRSVSRLFVSPLSPRLNPVPRPMDSGLVPYSTGLHTGPESVLPITSNFHFARVNIEKLVASLCHLRWKQFLRFAQSEYYPVRKDGRFGMHAVEQDIPVFVVRPQLPLELPVPFWFTLHELVP